MPVSPESENNYYDFDKTLWTPVQEHILASDGMEF
jgi:hypothetical protein